MAVRFLTITPDLVKKLESSGFRTVQDVVRTPPLDLLMKTCLTKQKVEQIYQAAYSFNQPKPVSALKLLHDDTRLRIEFGLRELDSHFSGGLRAGTLTELSGPPGSGKTQLCNLIALHTTVISQRGVVYVDAEGSFSAGRLLEIGTLRYPEKLSSEESVQSAFSRIKVLRPQNLMQLIRTLRNLELSLVKHRCSLLIIDSIGSLSRRQFGRDQAVARAARLGSLASQLKSLAHDLGFAVILTNHVTFASRERSSRQKEINATLGPSWAHWVNARIVLMENVSHNQMEVVKSPELPELILHYEITPNGVQITNE